ncbi:MAG: hypothetical protein WCH98_02805, partial [Verrucomicrobiota bacterium]
MSPQSLNTGYFSMSSRAARRVQAGYCRNANRSARGSGKLVQGMSRKGFWFGLLLVAGMLGGVSPDSNAQTIWKGTGAAGGNGTWATAGEWSAGVPTTLVDARFQVDGTLTTAAAAIAVTGAQNAKSLQLGKGKTVTLNFDSGASLAVASATVALVSGGAYGTGSGASSLTLAGPGTGSASLSLFRFDLVNNSALTFTGNLTATGNGDSSIGRSTSGTGNNTMSVLNGASFSLTSLSIGRGTSNNIVLVSGASSVMSASTTMTVGSSDTGSAANALQVQSGGSVTITGLATLGQGTGGHSNYYEATGANSTITFTGGIRVGDQTATPLNNGGNYLRFASGGTGKFAAALDINSYDSSGTNYGSNYVKV